MTYSFAGKHALVLHPSAEMRDQLVRRLGTLGIKAEGRWPALEEADVRADLLVLDLDRAEDGQFPWSPQSAPMPILGLIGSETPGRLEWAVRQGLDAYLPVNATANIYSALVLGFARFKERMETRRREAESNRRASMRLELLQAVLVIMRSEGVDEATALKKLRAFAMVERVALEDAAVRFLARPAMRGQA
ncbi:hypothetical protein PXK30_21965 [Phaeobacter gallaeciensis]|uniref:ANTAR domain-containing response regulator n=1 Tax=Rhodobacterales TaxID=204455 RepID=UPI00237F4CCC|nr:hypothetical protein [Phaeobacter gallaeciensis]MEC9312671.1 hypothetical protein [Pseudomonadota bacterium]MDE4099961.1 hypothetical protein [Phaeobacter gallaeciensis]MDE4108757.1 hypothetical protein [Phaeobacter gallaeciensis]MDE4113212.1 hypothetical protein [Phaeobacter gallaeciensis]MDE4117644.1 hypothetical protein [Phaeobacter gallaeciensis]